jgi:hypothetical protein
LIHLLPRIIDPSLGSRKYPNNCGGLAVAFDLAQTLIEGASVKATAVNAGHSPIHAVTARSFEAGGGR